MRQKSDDWRMMEPRVGGQQKNQSFERGGRTAVRLPLLVYVKHFGDKEKL